MEFQSFSIATTAHGAGVVFSREERQRHVYIIGKSGSGKSTFLFNLAMGDIYAGEGVAVIDPHGDLAEDILDAIPRSRINDVCYLDAGETNYPVGFNPATRIAPERRALAASGSRRRVAALIKSRSRPPNKDSRLPPRDSSEWVDRATYSPRSAGIAGQTYPAPPRK